MNRIPGLHIAQTADHGRGVFTAIDIQKNDTIEICPIIQIPKLELPIIHKTVLHDYYFLWGERMDECVIALGFGSLYNHRIQPNANFILDLTEKTIDIFAIENISAGAEITINYHGAPGDQTKLWF